MNRRSIVKGLVLGGAAAACPTCLGMAEALASEKGAKTHGGGAPHWEYTGDAGPTHWGELSPANSVCSLGLQQSPIDIHGQISAEMDGISVDYGTTPLRVVNNGHTIQANCDPGSRIVLDGETYNLLQFHFHHPSEHQVDGKPYPMECHFVHASDSGVLAVLGVFIESGGKNATLAPIWDAMPQEAGDEVKVSSVTISPAELLPHDRRFYRYYGSLTTPPCSEKVIWSVYRQPVTASAAQINTFGTLFPMNARPIQRLNRRFLLLGSL